MTGDPAEDRSTRENPYLPRDYAKKLAATHNIPPHILERHNERYRKIMDREMTVAEALEENQRDWSEFLAREDQ